MMRSTAILAALALTACGAGDEAEPAALEVSEPPAEVEAPEEATAEVTDYQDMENWLCHPGKTGDACDIDLDYTIVNADGSTEVQAYSAAEAPAIDCFYIYPTVSMDETPNSDLEPGGEEMRVIESQFARFGEQCRLYAPMYRQMTIPELRRRMMGGDVRADEEIRWSDVSGAWRDYVETQNDGRGVVLIGHSQGAHMLEELIAREIAGSDIEDRVLSVMPIGWTAYPDEASGGVGPFPPCETLGQTGCSVSYVSFRESSPPPARSRFGVTSEAGERALCVNPAALTGNDGALEARLSARNWLTDEQDDYVEGTELETPFVALPGMLRAACVESEAHTYLEVTVDGDPNDPRVDDIAGDIVVAGQVLSDWGLHLVDMNIAMGDLITIVEAQAESWASGEEAAD